jgi:hypothetical protein
MLDVIAPAPSNNEHALADRHARNNAATADYWQLYGEHRARVLALLRAASAPGDRVWILGAGNANDLELDDLAAPAAAVHLVDLDAGALDRAFTRQAPATRAKLVSHAPVDASGLLSVLPVWRRQSPPPAQVTAHAAQAAARLARALPGPFDVVVSDCLLTQMYWSCFEALGAGPLLDAVLEAALAMHLQAMTALARPGGVCLLLTDTVSSDSVPLQALHAAGYGQALLTVLDERGALFSGTGPRQLQAALARAGDGVDAASVGLARPWLWRVEPARTVLVYALAWRAR